MEHLCRKELQALAKKHNVKANQANALIVEALLLLNIEGTSTTTDGANVENVEPSVKCAEATSDEWKTSDIAEVFVESAWILATVKRVNKKTIRVVVPATGAELSVSLSEIRKVSNVIESSQIESTTETINDVPTTDAVAQECIVEEVITETIATDDVQIEENVTTAASISCEAEVVTIQSPLPGRKSMTPHKAHAVFVPKTTKAQRARQEATQQKIKVLAETKKRMSTSNVMAETMPSFDTTSTNVSSKMPDFGKLHKDQFGSSKPISSVLKRSHSLDEHLATTLHDAAVNGFQEVNASAAAGKIQMSSRPSSAAPTPTSAFKARQMPNFKSLHNKLSVSTTAPSRRASTTGIAPIVLTSALTSVTADSASDVKPAHKMHDKENASASVTNKPTANMRRASSIAAAKTHSSNVTDRKKTVKGEIIAKELHKVRVDQKMKCNQDKRASAIQARRSVGQTKTPVKPVTAVAAALTPAIVMVPGPFSAEEF